MDNFKKVKNLELDQSMIQRNLQLTPQQRVENHQSALNLFNELKLAGQKHYGKPQRTTQKITPNEN